MMNCACLKWMVEWVWTYLSTHHRSTNVAYHPYFMMVTLCSDTHLIQNQMPFEPTHSCQCSPLLPWVGSPDLAVNAQSMRLPLRTPFHQTVWTNHHGTPRSRLDTTVCNELQWLLTYKRFSELVEMNHGQQRPLLCSAAILKHLCLKLKCLGFATWFWELVFEFLTTKSFLRAVKWILHWD